jgi:hypothetical protein
LIDELSYFDVPSGFAVGVNSVTASLNNRKDFLDSLGLLNKVGLEQDGLTFDDSGVLRIGGLSDAELNARLTDYGAGKLTLIPTSTFRRHMGSDYPKLSSTEIELINPAPIPRLMGDKALQYWEFYESDLVVPPWQPLDHYFQSTSRSQSKVAVDALERDFIDDAPLVLKARSSTHGEGIWFYPGGIADLTDDLRSGSAPPVVNEGPGEFLIQYAIPHESDLRVVAAGDTPVAGEYRYGSPETDKSNLNLVDTGASSLREAAVTLLDMGAVEPLGLTPVDTAVENAVTDLFAALETLTAESTSDLHTWIGWDFLVVDPDDERLDAVPDDVVDGLFRERYRTDRGQYLVFGEGNLSPGSKERYVNAIAHGREGLYRDSAANLLRYGLSITRRESYTPGVPGDVDTEKLAVQYGL